MEIDEWPIAGLAWAALLRSSRSSCSSKDDESNTRTVIAANRMGLRI